MALNVAVFKSDFLKKSETFVISQTKYMRNVNIRFLCCVRDINGLEINNQNVHSVYGSGIFGKLIYRMFCLTRSSRSIEKFLVNEKIDVIHVHFAVDASLIIKIAHKLDIPVIVTLHGYDVCTDKEVSKPRFLAHKLYFYRIKRMHHLVHTYIAVSKAVLTDATLNGFPTSKLKLSYIGVDLDEDSFVSHYINKKLNITFAGRLVEKKGCKYLIEAAIRLLNNQVPVEFTIIGDGPELASIVSSIPMKNRDSFTFTGALRHDDLLESVSKCDIFCLPSCTAANGDKEGLPITILEAMYLSKPIVSTIHSGIPEAVIDGYNGILCNERSSQDIFDAILTLVQDEQLRKTLGHNSNQLAFEKFDLKKCTAILEDNYYSLCQS